MKRFIIERDIPGVGGLTPAQIMSTAKTSNGVLASQGSSIQWVSSFVTGDRIYCEYLAENEQLVRDHAKGAGLPANKISEVKYIVDPMSEFKQV